MTLEDYRGDMEMCCRCSICKFIPLEQIKSARHTNVCPSISKFDFHAYAGGGRMGIGMAVLEGRVDLSEKLLDVVYNCQMCGACDVSCKYAMDMEVLDPMIALRQHCVDAGKTIAVLDGIVEGLRTKGEMVSGAAAERDRWADGLDVKNIATAKAEVVFHAGCRACTDKTIKKNTRSGLRLLKKAGVDVGMAGDLESCCGGRAYEMGYQDDFIRQARRNAGKFKQAGARLLVTGCAECCHAFKVAYPKSGVTHDLKVLHISEYLDELIKAGRLILDRQAPVKVTYHDPCHLGRLGEPHIPWSGKQVPGQIRLFDPPKAFRRGTDGVYEPPRTLIQSIPGVTLVEMDRNREYAWCCGAGGGVRESNRAFAQWTAVERIKEAEATGAEAIITACPGCRQNLGETIEESGSKLDIYDIAELLDKAVE